MAVHEISGQVFTHQLIWNSASSLLSQPETKSPRDGYFRMAGMVMAYFTLEAYVNLLGPYIDREAWKNEREFFSKLPYRGTDGKLKRICEKIGWNIERDKRPYQTIRELRALRDFLAHGKPESYADEIKVKDGGVPDMFRGVSIYDMITAEKAQRVLKDTEQFLDYLHAKTVEKFGEDEIILAFKPLHFPLASAQGGEKRS